MTVPAAKPHRSIREYLESERASNGKHEFHAGEILAMSGGSAAHSTIALNVGAELRNRLKGQPCRAFESNLRIAIPKASRYVYPDASVICGPLQFDPADPNGETVLNPRLIVEVLSPSTEAYDRREKFDSYRQIESLQEYVLVSQDRPRIEVYFRQADGSWAFTVFSEIGAIAKFRSIGVDLPLSEAFAGVEFSQAD